MSNSFGTPNESETNSFLEVELCLSDAVVQNDPPIKAFEDSQRELIIRAGGTRISPGGSGEPVDTDPELIRLLLLGLVSCTENYFRQLLALLLTYCPECQRICSTTEIKYSAARYHQALNISLSLLDESVFSSSQSIEAETKRLTGISPCSSGSVKAALAEYHKVCIIRHASVHSHGLIGAKNAVDLGISPGRRYAVLLSVTTFERIAEICVNLVRAYNAHLWTASVSRLVDRQRLKFDGAAEDERLFTDLQRIFWLPSRMDAGGEGAELYEAIRGGAGAAVAA